MSAHITCIPFRSDGVLEEGIRLLEDMTTINKNAKEAVSLGDGTLKEANDTYETLTGKNNNRNEIYWFGIFRTIWF